MPPGVGAKHLVVVHLSSGSSSYILEDGNRGAYISYSAPEVSSLSPTYSFSGASNASFAISGYHFGNKPDDLQGISIGGQECDVSQWISPS